MPSKRHGYLTRKEWLAYRLNLARERAGGFDIDRLLRWLLPSTKRTIADTLRIDFETVEARIGAAYGVPDYKRPPADTNKQMELYAEAFRRMGHTDVVVTVGPPTEADKVARRSPTFHAMYNDPSELHVYTLTLPEGIEMPLEGFVADDAFVYYPDIEIEGE